MHKKEQMICREKAFGIICFFIQEKMFYNLEWKRARSMQEKEMALFFRQICVWMVLYFDQRIFSGTKAQSGSCFNGMNTVAAFDAFDEMVTPRIVRSINQIQTSLIDGNGV